MSNQFETGHVINVANLLRYNEFLATLGQKYNPSLVTITIASLVTLQVNAKIKLDVIKAAEDTWKSETNYREILFGDLNPFATRLLATLKSTSAPQQTIDDMASLVVKIRGAAKHVYTKPDAVAPGTLPLPPVPKSNSQRSFDQKIEHFSKIILLLQGVPDYAPNEPELQVATLQARINDMVLSVSKVATATANLKAARIDRNTFFYAPESGLFDLVKKSKAYLLGIYGKTSQQYQAASAFKFKRVTRKA